MIGLQRIWQRRDGNIAVEVALSMPILLALLAGITDLGRAVLADARLKSAVRAGLEYAQVNPNHGAGIEAVVRTAASEPGVTVTTAQVCQCPDGSTVECSVACGDGQPPGGYIVINAEQAFTALFPGMSALIAGPLQAQGSIRAK